MSCEDLKFILKELLELWQVCKGDTRNQADLDPSILEVRPNENTLSRVRVGLV